MILIMPYYVIVQKNEYRLVRLRTLYKLREDAIPFDWNDTNKWRTFLIQNRSTILYSLSLKPDEYPLLKRIMRVRIYRIAGYHTIKTVYPKKTDGVVLDILSNGLFP